MDHTLNCMFYIIKKKLPINVSNYNSSKTANNDRHFISCKRKMFYGLNKISIVYTTVQNPVNGKTLPRAHSHKNKIIFSRGKLAQVG